MTHSYPAIQFQDSPRTYLVVIPGKWLLTCVTPSWRIKDPIKGFQRRVSEARAREIAAAVLDQRRTFPNAIVIATDSDDLSLKDGYIRIPQSTRFLIVDGQHRLWAQNFAKYEAPYACIIHVGLDEVKMAELFIEINDNQRRVPSSLRWDLFRLVRPGDNPHGVRAAELIYELATTKGTALFQKIDLTGETPVLTITQGSLAPEIKRLVSSKKSQLKDLGFELQYQILNAYFAAIKNRDPDGWKSGESNLASNRVLRALLQLLPKLINHIDKEFERITARDFIAYLNKIILETLDLKEIRGAQGSAG
ncbi:MAG: DGQHR domain-containing protein, partial [Nitrosopumilaceae archaeon]